MTCKVEGCNKPKRARGMCMKHYQRWFRHGSTDSLRRSGCDVEGCRGNHHARGFCYKDYYSRYRRRSRRRTPSATGLCEVGECRGKHKARGMCTKHYQRWLRSRDVIESEHIPQGLPEFVPAAPLQKVFRAMAAQYRPTAQQPSDRGYKGVALRLGMSVRQVERIFEYDTIRYTYADRYATRLGLSPAMLWPEWSLSEAA